MTESTSPAAAADLDLRLSRHLPASPEEAFDAYTAAEKQRAWFSILDEELGIVENSVALRLGRTQTAVWGPSKSHLFRETQTFLEIEGPRRLVTRSVGSSPDGVSMTTYTTVTFAPVEGGTFMSLQCTGILAPEVRDFFVEDSWPGAFDRIEALLERVALR